MEDLWTRIQNMARVDTSNSTNTSALSDPTDTATKPTNATTGYWIPDSRIETGDIVVPNHAIIGIVGTDAANETGETQIFTVKAVEHTAGTASYTHIPLLQVDAILGSRITGNTNETWADTLAVSSNLTGLDDDLVVRNAAKNTDFANACALIALDLLGGIGLFFQFKGVSIDSADAAASLNAVVGTL